MGTWKSFVLFLLVMAGCAGPLLGADCTCDVNRDGEITPLDALLIRERQNGKCPTSLRIACEDICCGPEDNLNCSAEHAEEIFQKYMGSNGLCSEINGSSQMKDLVAQNDFFAKQNKAHRSLIDLVEIMRNHLARFGVLSDSPEVLGFKVKKESCYQYRIHALNQTAKEFRVTATLKEPIVNAYGEPETDSWTMDQNMRLTHSSVACVYPNLPPNCPQTWCVPCLWDQKQTQKNLTEIADLQMAYYAKFGKYADDFAQIEWTPSVYDKYSYTVSAAQDTFAARAESKAPGIRGYGEGDDIWNIDENYTLVNWTNACSECIPVPNSSPPPLSGYDCDWCLEMQQEPVKSLKKIFALQENYSAEHDTYASDLNSLGFVSPPYSRYNCSIIEVSGNTFTASADFKFPETGGEDKWTINQSGELKHIANFCPLCPGMTSGAVNSEILRCNLLPEECETKQIEAGQSLGTISKNQEAYFAENDTYAACADDAELLAKLGVAIKSQNPLYSYKTDISNNGMGFLATAASKEPGISGKGSGDDVWTIDHNLQLVNTVNGCACGNSQDGLRGCAVECWPQDQGLIGQISASDTELTLTVSLSKTENALGSFGFDLLYAPYALKFKTSLPGLLLQNFDKFSVREISPGRISAGGYTTGTPIPENTDGTLATLTFDILSPCSTDLKFVSLKDSMVSWQEHQIQFGTLTGNGLADAIALLRIAAGQNAEIPACIPDIGNDGRKGLAEAVWLLQWAAELR